MITEEKNLNTEEIAEDVPAEEVEDLPRFGPKDLGRLIISGEFYAALVFSVCAGLCLYIGGHEAEAFAVGGILLVSALCVVVAGRQQQDMMNLDRRAFQDILFSVYRGRVTRNALRMPLAMRLAPLGLGLVCAIAFLVRRIFGGAGDYNALLSIMAIFSASAALGLELPAVIAISDGVMALKQRDIEVGKPAKFGTAARAKTLLADKSVYFASKGTETGGVYINGKAYGVSELNLKTAYPLLAALYVCDDGALSAAFGFRTQIFDGLLRALRTTQFENSARFAFHTVEMHPYDPEKGYAMAVCVSPDGVERTYFAGKPSAIFPGLGYEADEMGLKPLGEADLRHLRLHLRRTYSAGREVMAVAEMSDGGDSLVLIGLLHMNCIISEEARESVAELKSMGLEPVYVSEENENCAFYQARELGIARDMSQVLTGSRIERFRHENLVRAARHARLCAEAEDGHRRALTKLLSGDRVVMAASRTGSDELLRCADVRVSSVDGCYNTDFVSRNCSIEVVSIVTMVSKSVCAVAHRAEYQMLCAPVCAMLLTLFTVIAYGTVPFGVGAMLLLSALLPMPQMFITAKMEVGPAKGFMMPVVMGKTRAENTPVTSGFGLVAWNVINCIAAAVFAAYIFGSYAAIENVGMAGASTAVFLTLGAYMLANSTVCRVWGKSCVSLKDEDGGVKFLIATALGLIAVFAIGMFSGVAGILGLEALEYKHMPLTLVPAVGAVLVYEIGGAIIRHRGNREK